MSTAQTDPALFAAWAHVMAQHTQAVLAQRTTDGRPVWLEDLRTPRGNVYRVLITDDHPPRAYLLRPRIGSVHHKLSDGSLCLFTTSSINRSVSPLAVRTRAIAWLEAYEHWRCTGHWMFDE